MAEDPAAPDAALNPVPYHVSANLYHAINAALFFLVALRLFTWRGPGRPDWPVLLASAFAALLFSLHPLRVESVAWITERRDLVSQMFLLLTVLAYLRMCRAERATAVVPIAPIGIAGGLIGASALIATTT